MRRSVGWLCLRAPRAGTVCSDWAWGSDFVWPSPASTRKRYNCDRKIAGNSPMAEATQSNKRARLHIFLLFWRVGPADHKIVCDRKTTTRARSNRRPELPQFPATDFCPRAAVLAHPKAPVSLSPRTSPRLECASHRASSCASSWHRRARHARVRAGRGRGNGAWAARRGGTNGRPVQYKFTQK